MEGSVPLPQELVDQIIDELSDDREALKACALTSRRWLHRCRSHLHHTLTLRHRNYHVHPRSRVDKAIELLALPAIIAYAKVLHIRGEPSNLCFHHDADVCDDAAAKDAFWRVLEKTACVRTVEITELYCGDVLAEDTQRFCAALRDVKHLSLSDCEFRNPDELRTVLAACHRLQTLRLGWIFWSHNTSHEWGTRAASSNPQLCPSLQGTNISFIRLKHLQVGHCARKMDESIVQIFVSAGGTTNIKRLSLGPTDLDIEMLPAWIRVVGTSLEHLCLSFGQIGHPDVAKRVAGYLQHCHKLQKLTLCAKPWSASVSTSANPLF